VRRSFAAFERAVSKQTHGSTNLDEEANLDEEDGVRRNDRGVADAHVDYALDNRPSTGRGKWAAGYRDNASAHGLVPRKSRLAQTCADIRDRGFRLPQRPFAPPNRFRCGHRPQAGEPNRNPDISPVPSRPRKAARRGRRPPAVPAIPPHPSATRRKLMFNQCVKLPENTPEKSCRRQ
jgi:hypothetical protein